MLSTHRLSLLVAFARHGSIAAAAEALGYTPSAVSQQLVRLEQEAGVGLLDRSARSAELTDAGRLLAEHAQLILAAAEDAEAALAAQAGVISGEVRVAALPSAALAFAPLLVRQLRRHRQLRLVFVEAVGPAGVAAVRERVADIALVERWAGAPAADPALFTQHLVHDPLELAVPRRHWLANPDAPVDLGELVDESWIIAPPGEPSRAGVERLMAPYGGVPAGAWEFEGQSVILSLVAHGAGIAAVPALTARVGTAGVVRRAIPGAPVAREIDAVARTSTLARPAVAATLAALRSAAQQLLLPTP
ncbi:LysR family transcriptional regulator [Nocardioides limicola]|uniref:LysR family transcriptional regulator n=1 Tax=Nocardioides limicola TaxID=2803368 RepID=UPI00193B2A4E|nr:LysR family transcriptional regulator [Nocardioides sp. DJM-14]